MSDMEYGEILYMRLSTSKVYAPLGLSLVIHIGLILWAYHVDTHPQRFGGLRYTDVDWRVVTDGSAHIFGKIPGKKAEGWSTQLLKLPIGDPYERATFRYTPLLPLVLSPALVHDLLGKLTLTCLSLVVPLFLLSGPHPASPWPTHALWTLNPVVLNITTRGSPESIIVLLVVATVFCTRKADEPGNVDRAWWQGMSAMVWALSVSWKIYPIIYGIAIWTSLAGRHGWLGREVWRFGSIAAGTFIALNGLLWSIWGRPFLDHTFLYHLTRQDHRHNFSPYFYPIYLSFFSSNTASSHSSSLLSNLTGILQRMARNPLSSFIPQFGLVSLAGFLLPQNAGLEFTVFIQTAIFVIFNKVCTSQYFVWFIPLLAPILSRLDISKKSATFLTLSWIISQALWLYTAYRLELLGESVHLGLWACGIGLLGTSTWIIGRLIDSFRPVPLVNVVSPRRDVFFQSGGDTRAKVNVKDA